MNTVLKRLHSLLFCLMLFFAGPLWAATIYVDQTLVNNITNGTYSVFSRNGTGSDGDAYKTVQEALDAMNTGDHVYLRGDTYQEGHIRLDRAKNGTAWSEGNYNLIASLPGEWAVLDGQNGGGEGGPNSLVVGGDSDSNCVIGRSSYPFPGDQHLAYWKFERLEIINGRSSDGNHAAGFWGTKGPFWFRYCSVHDNVATTMSNNPAGLKGHVWNNCIVEYCYFRDNGSSGTHSHNEAHINIYSDYEPNAIAKEGFDAYNSGNWENWHNQKNTYRYNYFYSGTYVGIKYKQDQFFSGRNPDAGLGYSDAYKDFGDTIHHNIFYGLSYAGIDARQDFMQIYKNIFDSCVHGIAVGEHDTRSIYKAVVYNNTIKSPVSWGIWRIHKEFYVDIPNQETAYYGYDFNNILYDVQDGWNWSDIAIDTEGFENPDYSTYVGDRNYFYQFDLGNWRDPDGTKLYWIGDARITESEYEALYLGCDLFFEVQAESQGCFLSASGVNSYITDGNHVVQGATTISDGGIGGNHPYLEGITIPIYIGATNPGDHSWVSGVLSLADTDTMKNAGSEDPAWIEGALKPVVLLNGWPSIVTTDAVTVTGTAMAKGGYTIVSVELTGAGEISGEEEWTANLNLDLGENQFAVKVTDDNGQSSEVFFTIVREAVTITIDTPNNQRVSSDIFEITGTALTSAAGTISTVTCPGLDVIPADGAFDENAEEWKTTATLSEGGNTFVFTVTDSAGVTSEAAISVVYDIPPPTLTFTTENGETVTNVSLIISGTASAAPNRTVSNVSAPGLTVTGTTNWRTTATLVEGSNVFYFTVMDSAGKESESYMFTVTYEPTAYDSPTIEITTQNNQTVTDASFLISGTASADVSLSVASVTSPGLEITGTTDWRAEVTLAKGVNHYTFTVTDSAGKTVEATLTVTYAPEAALPTLTLTTPNNQTVAEASFRITGTASAPAGRWIARIASPGLMVIGTTNWRTDVTLTEGVNHYTFTVTDSAGKTSEATLTVTYAPKAAFPTLTLTTPNNQTVAEASFRIIGTASAPAGRTVDRIASPGLMVIGTTNWRTDVTLAEGENHYTFTVTDSAGKTAEATLTATYAPKAAFPTLTLTIPNNQTVTDATFHITGTASAPAGRTVVSVTSPGLTVEGTTSWRADVTLSKGEKTYTFTVTDSEGETAEATLTVTYDDSAPSGSSSGSGCFISSLMDE